MNNRKIIYKTPSQIKNIRESGKYLDELLFLIKDSIKPWIKLIELENIAQDYISKNNLKWAFKWYEWFPANLCLSVNDCVVHGIPDETVLQKWDVLKVDTWVVYNKGISDSAFSVIVGSNSHNKQWYNLINATKTALDNALEYVWPGKNVYNFSKQIYNHITAQWFKVLKRLTGHGVGTKVHEPPYVHNRPYDAGKDIYFKPNMVVCLEPISSLDSDEYKLKKGNDWNLYTEKWWYGAQREYMVLITDDGYELLSGLCDVEI